MFNVFYKESKEMKQLREDYRYKVEHCNKDSLTKICNSLDMSKYSIDEEDDSRRAYLDGYENGQIDGLFTLGLGFTIGYAITTILNRLKK